MLSIITISYCDIEGLTRTIESVKSQEVFSTIGQKFEQIVVSSGLNELDCKILRSNYGGTGIKFVFNQDTGLYNAMNIGTFLSSGTHVFYLNGGDEFFDPTSLGKIIERLSEGQISLFRVAQYYDELSFVRPGLNSTRKRKHYSHQGFVAPLTESTPMYQESYKINADSYWMRECLALWANKEHPEIISKFELGGISNRPCVRTIRLRLSTEGGLSAIKEATKFIMFKIMGAKKFYNAASIRAGYDRDSIK